ncbi:MAG: small basic protein [Planctomycetota bacterium]|jgi:small basic protein (TIGR04137 family)
MSVDRSLKVKGALSRHHNVLTRAERIKLLKDEEKWSEGESVFGLVKVAHRKGHAGRKAKAAPSKPGEGEQPTSVEETTEQA